MRKIEIAKKLSDYYSNNNNNNKNKDTRISTTFAGFRSGSEVDPNLVLVGLA